MNFTNTVTINRPPAEVFAFLAELENLPRWNYALSETRKITTGPVGVGARYLQTRTLPARSEEALEVTAYEPDRLLAIRGPLGPFESEVSYVLTPAGGGTSLANTMDLRPTGAARLIAPLAGSRVKSAVATNLAALKQLLENG
ncbi:SRPBCC family protein [Asanoa sp. NPDC049573]|uniref:SRPBCC family protein n=1 Tax=Asanoa sp. NPDC049573 TaxID=3155396 RepID=UPI00343507F5